MQPPVFSVIGQRLVPRVDDGAIKLHPLIDVVDDMISALAQLKIYLGFRLGRFEVKRQRIRLTHSAGAGEDLSSSQKRQERPENRRGKLRLAFHQVVLMT